MNENPNEKEFADLRHSLHKRTRRHMAPKFVLIAVLGIPLFGVIVMLLWNWLAPAVFGLHQIGFLQALGVLVLSRILFGGFHGRHHGGPRWNRHLQERWEGMTPEERQRMMEALRTRSHCGPRGTPATESQA